MKTTRPSELETHAGYWLRCLSNFVSHTFAGRLETLDLSVAQWVVLRMLHDHDGVALHEAARQVGVDKSTLSRMVERLVQRGLVDRTNGPDRRTLGLSLTDAGRKLVLLAARLADENDQVFFGTLSAARREEFLTTVKQLLTANGWNVTARGRDRME